MGRGVWSRTRSVHKVADHRLPFFDPFRIGALHVSETIVSIVGVAVERTIAVYEMMYLQLQGLAFFGGQRQAELRAGQRHDTAPTAVALRRWGISLHTVIRRSHFAGRGLQGEILALAGYVAVGFGFSPVVWTLKRSASQRRVDNMGRKLTNGSVAA